MEVLVFRDSENESEEEEVEEEIEEKKDNTSEEEDKKVDKYLFLIYPMKYKYKYTRNAHLDVAKKRPKPSRPALTTPPPKGRHKKNRLFLGKSPKLWVGGGSRVLNL